MKKAKKNKETKQGKATASGIALLLLALAAVILIGYEPGDEEDEE